MYPVVAQRKVSGCQEYTKSRWDWVILRMWGVGAPWEGLEQYLGPHLFCRVIIFWLPWFVEVQDGVGAQADGADSWVVQWSILMGLGRGTMAGQAGVQPSPTSSGPKEGSQAGMGR
jgi:hypothetical protein